MNEQLTKIVLEWDDKCGGCASDKYEILKLGKDK